ncbi:hypothetical protein ACWF50_13290 [Brucella pseudogrignonensis]
MIISFIAKLLNHVFPAFEERDLDAEIKAKAAEIEIARRRKKASSHLQIELETLMAEKLAYELGFTTRW